MSGWSEPLGPDDDVWGWVEADEAVSVVVTRPYYGYHRLFSPGNPSVAKVFFDEVDAVALTVTQVRQLDIGAGPTIGNGGQTGGWNGDKTRFAIIRNAGATQHLTYVDASDDDPSVWALAPDIVDVTAHGGDAGSRQLRFIPPDGQKIGWLHFTTAWILRMADVDTAAFTTVTYPSLFPTFTGDIRWYQHSPNGLWVAYGVDGNAPSGVGLKIYERSSGNLLYSDAAANLGTGERYRLWLFTDDSTMFTYQAGNVTKRVSTATWTVTSSFTTTTDPRPRWASPDASFYYGGETGGASRIFDSTGTVVRTGTAGSFDWNQEGTIACGAEGFGLATSLIRTPGFQTASKFVDNEFAYRMIPWR